MAVPVPFSVVGCFFKWYYTVVVVVLFSEHRPSIGEFVYYMNIFMHLWEVFLNVCHVLT